MHNILSRFCVVKKQFTRPRSSCCHSFLSSPSLPALDWQLPSSSGPYSLQIDVQPKSHHRAHYETEGSRGAVKALAGGHPVVQVFLNVFIYIHLILNAGFLLWFQLLPLCSTQ